MKFEKHSQTAALVLLLAAKAEMPHAKLLVTRAAAECPEIFQQAAAYLEALSSRDLQRHMLEILVRKQVMSALIPKTGNVLELASGFSLLSITNGIVLNGTYIETDQPGVIATKKKLMTETGLRAPNICYRPLLLGEAGAISRLIRYFGTGCLTVLVEDVFSYLPPKVTDQALAELRSPGSPKVEIRVIITSLISREQAREIPQSRLDFMGLTREQLVENCLPAETENAYFSQRGFVTRKHTHDSFWEGVPRWQRQLALEGGLSVSELAEILRQGATYELIP